MQNPPLHKLYIHGGYVDCAQPECEQFAAINPATGEVIAHLQSACEEDINWAVESAKQGQKYGLPCLRWRAPVFFDVPWIFYVNVMMS